MNTFSNLRIVRALTDARRRREAYDAGMTIVEMLVAMGLITVGVLGLLAGLAADIKQQRVEKTQTNAIHLANLSIEAASGESWASLVSLAGTTTTSQTVQGVPYTKVTTVQVCSPTDAPGVCTTPAAGAAQIARTTVKVSWNNGAATHHVQLSSNLANTSATTVSTSTSPLGSCGGSGTTLVLGNLSLSPSSVNVNTAGKPTTAVTATFTGTGLLNATCIPLSWTDDNGAHQVTMTKSGSTYTATIPASSITKTAATSGGTIPFTATVPGSQAVPTASLTIIGQPSLSNCSIQVLGLGLNTITLNDLLNPRHSLLASTLSCSATNISSTDKVVASYLKGTSSTNLSLTSTNGTSWTATLPAGSMLSSSGGTEPFTFTLTRTSDNSTATQTVTVTLV